MDRSLNGQPANVQIFIGRLMTIQVLTHFSFLPPHSWPSHKKEKEHRDLRAKNGREERKVTACCAIFCAYAGPSKFLYLLIILWYWSGSTENYKRVRTQSLSLSQFFLLFGHSRPLNSLSIHVVVCPKVKRRERERKVNQSLLTHIFFVKAWPNKFLNFFFIHDVGQAFNKKILCVRWPVTTALWPLRGAGKQQSLRDPQTVDRSGLTYKSAKRSLFLLFRTQYKKKEEMGVRVLNQEMWIAALRPVLW